MLCRGSSQADETSVGLYFNAFFMGGAENFWDAHSSHLNEHAVQLTLRTFFRLLKPPGIVRVSIARMYDVMRALRKEYRVMTGFRCAWCLLPASQQFPPYRTFHTHYTTVIYQVFMTKPSTFPGLLSFGNTPSTCMCSL